MNAVDVRFDIEKYTAWNIGEGALTVAEVDRLMRLARVADADGNEPDDYLYWLPSTAVTVGTLRVPTTRTGYVYRVTTAGTTGATEPSSWPTVLGQTVADGSVVWTVDAVASWLGVWDVKEAAAVGCEWRAAKLADQFPIEVAGGTKISWQWTPEYWEKKAEKLRGGRLTSIALRSASYVSS